MSRGTGFFIGKDVRFDLYHLHEATKKTIESIQKKGHDTFPRLYHLFQTIQSIPRPYGVTRDQEKIIDDFSTWLLSCPYSCPFSVITEETFTYKRFKEVTMELALFLELEQSRQYLPGFLSKVEPLIQQYEEEMMKPVAKSFFTNESSSSPSSPKGTMYMDQYIQHLEHQFNTETIEEIIQLAKSSSESFQTSSANRPKPLVGLRGNSRGLLGSELKLMQKELEKDEQVDTPTFDDDGEEKSDVYNGLNYQDLGRVNLNQKYKYEKRCHFRDTIQQYQGLQNKNIPDKVFEDVDRMIKLHDLYFADKEDPYYKITKNHVKQFLMETGNSKFYEDLQLIYSKVTNKPCPNISKYEERLYKEFDLLVEVFLSLKLNRKNFLNSHYVLRQLLRRQGLRVTDEELNCLKTPSRLREHDEIYQKCCDKLGWNFTSLV